jgi:hypothetical protein
MAITKRAPNTIILAGNPPVTTDIEAGAALIPGYLLQMEADGDGTPQWNVHGTADGPVHGMILLLENGELNKGVSDACADGETVKAAHLRSGDQAWVLVPSAENLVIGTRLQSNGDGRFKALASGVGLCFALEAVVPSTVAKRVRVEVI